MTKIMTNWFQNFVLNKNIITVIIKKQKNKNIIRPHTNKTIFL